MKAERVLYNKKDLVRDLREILGPGVASVAFCNDVTSVLFLLVQKALAEGKRVAINGSAMLSVDPPRRIQRRTPQGELFEGFSYPRIRATIQKPLLREVLDGLAQADGTKAIAKDIQERILAQDAKAAKEGK